MTLDEAWKKGCLVKRIDWELWINKEKLGHNNLELFKKSLIKSGVHEKEIDDDKWEVSMYNC